MTETILDRARTAMDAAPEDDGARLRYYERLADAELFLLLEEEPTDDRVAPRLFDLEEGRFALAFDTEERLADFAAGPAAYAALPGRVVARELAASGVGLGLNLSVPSTAFLMSAEALGWLAGTLDLAPEEAEARPVEVAAPAGLPDRVLTALDAKLAGLAGLARAAHLVSARYSDGSGGHMLAFEMPRPGAEAPLAKAVSEALVFSGADQGRIDVVFLRDNDPLRDRVARVALTFDLPVPEATPMPKPPEAPGMDPSRPPRLR